MWAQSHVRFKYANEIFVKNVNSRNVVLAKKQGRIAVNSSRTITMVITHLKTNIRATCVQKMGTVAAIV